jgi:hypothetical protein
VCFVALLRELNGDVAGANIRQHVVAVIRANPATLFIALTTMIAACILAIVALHALAN